MNMFLYIASGFLFIAAIVTFWYGWRRYSVGWMVFSTFVMLLACMSVPTKANAAVPSNGMTICIKEYIHGSLLSNARSASRYLDSQTGSSIVRGNACTKYSFIVNIRTGRVPQVTPHGRTYGYTSPSLHTITIDPHTPAYARTRLLEHELGHVFGLHHTNACTIMKANLTCNRHLVSERFSNAEKATLRSH